MTSSSEDKSTGMWLIIGGVFGAILCLIMIIVGATADPLDTILVVVGSFAMLLPAYLVGYGIKKIASG